MQMIAVAWRATTYNFIQNCGFKLDAQLAVNGTSEEEDCSPIVSPSTDTAVTWPALCDYRDVPIDVELDECTALDMEVIAHEQHSGEKINESVCHCDASSDDCDEQDITALRPLLR